MLEVNGERWLSAKDVAERFRKSASTVHCWHRKKGLPLVSLMGGMHIEEKALAAWMHAQGRQPAAEYGKPQALAGRR